MSGNHPEFKISFLADKVYVHKWPLGSPDWASLVSEKIDTNLNKNKEKKQVWIDEKTIKVDNFSFVELKKIGVTVPFFKKETTLIFEGKTLDSFAHIHITTRSDDYLEIFNNLMSWKNRLFPS